MIVKIQNRDRDRDTKEKDLIKKLEEDEVPGVVRLANLQYEDERAETYGSRVRSTVVLKTIGHPLSTCNSLCEFFEVIFDLVESHRQMHISGVLHRDPSWGNVFKGPKDKSTEIPPARYGNWFIENIIPREK